MRSRTRWLALALALAGAFAYALAVQSTWWSTGEVSIGPFGSRHCFGGECRESALAWIGGSDLWMRSGVAARAGGYITMFVLVLVAAGLAAKRTPRLAAGATLTSVLASGAAGIYFAAAFPGVGDAELALGRGMFVFAAGIVLAIAAAITTLRMSSERPA